MELRDLNTAIGVALPRALDRETRAHLLDARDQIAKALDPRFAPTASVPTAGFPSGFEEEMNSNPNSIENFDPRDCWPDYAIKVRPRN
jgi:hypothetical protein